MGRRASASHHGACHACGRNRSNLGPLSLWRISFEASCGSVVSGGYLLYSVHGFAVRARPQALLCPGSCRADAGALVCDCSARSFVCGDLRAPAPPCRAGRFLWASSPGETLCVEHGLCGSRSGCRDAPAVDCSRCHPSCRHTLLTTLCLPADPRSVRRSLAPHAWAACASDESNGSRSYRRRCRHRAPSACGELCHLHRDRLSADSV